MNLLIPFLLSLGAGIVFAVMKTSSRRLLCILAIATAAVQAILLTLPLITKTEGITIWQFSQSLHISLHADGIGALLGLLTGWGWLLCIIFSAAYMRHEERESTFYAFLFLSQACLIGVFFADNLLSLYLFFEMTTLASLPLVLHSRTKDATAGGMSYLFYSLAGAIIALFGLMVIYHEAGTLDFVPGGYVTEEHSSMLLLIGIFACAIGFGAKGGLYPLHAWLPAAHPQAPAPASALLSGIITKSGVIAILRLLFYVIDPALIRGTWVQYTLLTLALGTILIGSALALTEKNLKRRLAFSSVSQVSYVLAGLFLLNNTAVLGALLQIIFHMIAKSGLFLCAGALIWFTGKSQAEDYIGLGKKYPAVFVCYTVFSLSLIGIPPAGGFYSKWYLAQGALENAGPFAYIVPIVLLVSALLTAGYLLPVTGKAFFSGKDLPQNIERERTPAAFLLPLILLAAAAILPGLFFPSVGEAVSALCAGIFG